MPDPLAQRTLELVDIPSESRNEAEIGDYVAAAMPWEPDWRDGPTLWYERSRGGRPLVVLAGHLDTVPAQGNIPGRIENGAVHGLGATDMKAGVAVMIELARHLARREHAYDVGFLFFPREELPSSESALPDAFAAVPRLRDAELAVMLEPTDNEVHAGCLGHIRGELVFTGTAAHSARPWTGVNAIAEAVRGLSRVVDLEPVDVEISGLVFREVLSVTKLEAGVADNVIPDRATAVVSYRFAPHRTSDEAIAELRRLLDGVGELVSYACSPGAPVVVDTELARRLRDAGPFTVKPKQAWTPVAEFAEAGIPALNLGPGATRYAHKRDEQVEIAELRRTFDALLRFLDAT